jgi:hypothetical protein
MRLHEITNNDKKLAEWDPNIIGWGLDALKDLTKGVRRRKDIDDYRKKDDNERHNDNDTKQVRRSGGSDDYDHIIKKYKNR